MSKRPQTTPTLLNALAQVSKPDKSKRVQTRTKGPGRLAQKKRTKKSKTGTRKIKEETNLAHITKAIVREGGTVPDVGMILGCQQMEGGKEWLDALKAKNLSITEFLAAAKDRVDIELIRVAVKAAIGYRYEEESQEFQPIPEIDEKTGMPTGKAESMMPGKKKISKKHQPEDKKLLWDLLRSRLPDYFSDVKHIKIDKRIVEIKADAEAEIRSFASGLLKAFGEESIDAEFVELPNAK